MYRKVFYAGLAALIMTSSAHASVIVGLLLNPATTAGAGSNSNRSGNNTWQLYAVDDSSGNFGIGSYDVQMSGTATVNHRSSNGTTPDSNDNPVGTGFSQARQTSPTIAASGPLPPLADIDHPTYPTGSVGVDYFPIFGFGQTAGSFAAAYPSATISVASGASWGTYTSPFVAPFNGKNWVFLAEGNGNPSLLSATATVYIDQNTGAQGLPQGGTTVTNLGGIPEPASLALLGLGAIGGLGVVRRRRA